MKGYFRREFGSLRNFLLNSGLNPKVAWGRRGISFLRIASASSSFLNISFRRFLLISPIVR